MNLREAAQMALEALEEHRTVRLHDNDYLGVCAWCYVDSCDPCDEKCTSNNAITALRAALADTQDWDEIEALRASLREHMAEIHRLRAAGKQACEALEYFDKQGHDVSDLLTPLRTVLAEDAMQRLTDEQQMIERGTKAWAGVPDATAWVEELRGNETVTDSHEKEGGKLSPPLHVGYRYQSPVGGWEYGDHIPAGFDTGKWAHQKIYILQEQS